MKTCEWVQDKVSGKRKEENKLYSELREQFLKDNTRCQIKFVGCEFSSVDVHHKASGSNKGTNLNNTDTWLAACRHCHTFLHDKISAQEAREKGLKI